MIWVARACVWWMALCQVVSMAGIVQSGRDSYLNIPQDDFYYYLVVARNLVERGLSTFDGVTLTNGYHPLWLGCIAALVKVFGTGPELFIAFSAVTALLGVVAFELFTALGRRLFPDSQLLLPLSILVGRWLLAMTRWGMELCVALPLEALFLYLLVRERPRFVLLGFVASLLALARLDAVILIGIALLLRARRPRDLVAFGAGGLPFAAYLVHNRVVFGSFATVSAQAKQLPRSFGVSTRMIIGLVTEDNGAFWPFVIASLALVIVLVLRRRRRLQLGDRAAALWAALLFPFLYYIVLSLRSDWILFLWYLYPLPLAFFLGAGVIERLLAPRARSLALDALTVILALLVSVQYVRWSRRVIARVPNASTIYAHAKVIAEFARTHPGTYAMGDRGGVPAFLLGARTVQLEGLAADQKMVDHIRREDPLREVLAEYRVDYLIVTAARLERGPDGYVVEQPNPLQAGDSRRMRGVFREPLLHHKSGGDWDPQLAESIDEMHTFIFSTKTKD